MEWFKFYVRDLKDRLLLVTDDAAVGAWIRLLAKCYELENGGHFEGCGKYTDRQWLVVAGVDREAVDKVVAAGLAAQEGDSLRVQGYDLELEEKATNRSRQNRELALRRWGNAKGITEGNAKGITEGNAEGEREGEEEKNTDTCPAGGPAGPAAVGEMPALELVPDEPKARRGAKPNASADVLMVIEHYRKYHPRSFPKPNPKAKEAVAIAARLRDGRTVEELCQCIDGYHLSPFHLGQNDRNTQYLRLGLFMSDDDHVNDGIKFARNPPKRDFSHGFFPAERNPRIGRGIPSTTEPTVNGPIDLDTGLPARARRPAATVRPIAVLPDAAKDSDSYRRAAEADAAAAQAARNLTAELAAAKGAT